ncbi:hypothetical protein [Actinoallomurus sp. CA-142502]|uniref:hypothetical protein n=1 Tax=Actinoallomurus sp. CA-142502 TaxID=3239885 RepID=UPI003D8B5372
MPDTRAKALAYLRDGKVLISYALGAGDDRKPRDVLAYVEGYRSTHLVRLTAGRWGCSCQETGCAHVAAVQLVTGHQSAAARQPAAVPAEAVR